MEIINVALLLLYRYLLWGKFRSTSLSVILKLWRILLICFPPSPERNETYWKQNNSQNIKAFVFIHDGAGDCETSEALNIKAFALFSQRMREFLIRLDSTKGRKSEKHVGIFRAFVEALRFSRDWMQWRLKAVWRNVNEKGKE